MNSREKNRKAFSKVLLAVLKSRRISQRQMAIDLDTSPSNFNQRIISGSMRPEMIMKINSLLSIDFLAMVQQYEQGLPIEKILDQSKAPEKEKNNTHYDHLDIEKVLADHSKAIFGLQFEIKGLVQQLNKWIENDIKKTKFNEQMINHLNDRLEEVKTVKTKTKQR